MPHPRRLRRVLLAALTCFALAPAALAQDCALEIEPNDTPATGTPLDGRSCLVGTMAGNDQDAWWWTVDDAAAELSWHIEMESIRGQLTKFDVIRVDFAANGVDVEGFEKLLEFGTPNGTLTSSDPFLVAPGRYLLALSKSGGEGEYVVHLRAGDRLTRGRSGGRLPTPTGAFAYTARLEGANEIEWTIDADATAMRWALEAQGAIGAPLTVELLDPSGARVGRATSDPYGRLTLASLGLSAGAYRIVIDGAGPFTIAAVATGTLTDGDEVEPNDTWEQANILSFDRPLRATGSNDDYFVVDVGPAQADRPWNLTVETSASARIILYDEARNELQRRSGAGGALRGLTFAEGRYFVYVRHDDDGPYTLAFEPGAAHVAGFEVEPNDTLVAADRLADDLTVRGALTPQDRDVFRFTVSGEPQLWRVQAVGTGVTEMTVYTTSGSTLQSVRGSGRLRLDQLVLLPGAYLVEVRGDEGDYALRLLAQGPVPDAPAPDPSPEAAAVPLAPAPAAPDAPAADDPAIEEVGPPPPPGAMESEPNDDPSRAQPLLPGQVRVGTLPNTGDRDVYRFFLAEDQLVRLEVVSPAGGAVEFDVPEAGLRASPTVPGGAAGFERTLLAGSYRVELRDREGAGGWYQLRLTLPDPLARPADREPNDDAATAERVPAELAWSGTVGDAGDEDYYLLPAFATSATLTLTAELDERVSLAHVAESPTALRPNDDGVVEVALAPGGPQYLRLRGTGRYRLDLAFDPAPEPSELAAPNGDPRARAAFDAPLAQVQAFAVDGQRVAGTITVENESDAPRSFAVEAVVNHPTATVEVPERVEVPAGGRVDVPIAALLPPDLRDDLPVRLTIGLRDDLGIATASQTLQSVCEAPPVDPRPVWPLPDALLGRFDVGWSAFGATPVDADGRAGVAIDGRVSPAVGVARDAATPLDVDLAGDAPVRLVGTVLHPLTNASVVDQLRRFEVWTSLDGVAFERAYAGTLRAARIDQPFVFDAPVSARFARLVFVDAHSGRDRGYVGSWQLIADGATDLGERNLADPAVGGHVVWSRPYHGTDPLTLDPTSRAGTLDGRQEAIDWAIGFHHGRAAQVTRIVWHPGDPDAPTSAREVTLSASIGGSLGPWTELGTWPIAEGAATVMALDAPTWVRYLRVEARGHDTSERQYALPSQVEVIERAVDAEYRSALGSWGTGTRAASYEFHVARDLAVAPADDVDDDSPERARPVASGAATSGTVAVAEDVDWLRVTVPEGENLLELRLAADPAIRYELLHADGRALVHEVDEDGADRVLRAFVEPGDYLLKLEEPRRSVAFVWDNSGSMGPYIDITYNALARFAADLDPEREFAQLAVFDRPPPNITWLLPYWTADPERAMRAITDYDRRAESSDALPALLEVARALAQRDGVRAMMVITDAETGGFNVSEEMWATFDEVRPRIFTFEVSSAGSDRAQDLMQDWAYAAGGDYRLATGVGDLDAGFARAACLLRRPKAYRVDVTTAYQTPPGPGTLRVVRGERAAQPAVEVIFDASGSMGQRLPSGESRIEVAKAVLEEFVRTGLPDDVPFALRAFGHITPNSCETRLDLPLAPLDRNAALSAVRAIEPKLFSQTPIAASIEAVADDLAGAAGPKSILLITDGVESCDGDPRAAVEGLRAAGMNVQLSIVSLGLDDPDDIAAFEALAAAVGASYVGTNDVAGLRDAVLAALAVPYQVLALDGTVVATGLVDGDPVELAAGSYRVRVGTELLEARVPGDGAVSLVTGR